jgi:hypothetical protein
MDMAPMPMQEYHRNQQGLYPKREMTFDIEHYEEDVGAVITKPGFELLTLFCRA